MCTGSPPSPPPPPPPPPTTDAVDVSAAGRNARRRAQARRGVGSTVLTSQSGVTAPATTGATVLGT